MIIRNDDVSPSSNFEHIKEIYDIIRKKVPDAEIWSCVNLFSKGSAGSVYPELPLKTKPREFFYGVNKIWEKPQCDLGRIVSHGLLHCDHTHLGYTSQEMSIVTSANLLNTRIFVPPFNRYNNNTRMACHVNKIYLVEHSAGWQSIETDEFCLEHKLWYFHSWRFTPEQFKEKINGMGSRNR